MRIASAVVYWVAVGIYGVGMVGSPESFCGKVIKTLNESAYDGGAEEEDSDSDGDEDENSWGVGKIRSCKHFFAVVKNVSQFNQVGKLREKAEKLEGSASANVQKTAEKVRDEMSDFRKEVKQRNHANMNMSGAERKRREEGELGKHVVLKKEALITDAKSVLDSIEVQLRQQDAADDEEHETSEGDRKAKWNARERAFTLAHALLTRIAFMHKQDDMSSKIKVSAADDATLKKVKEQLARGKKAKVISKTGGQTDCHLYLLAPADFEKNYDHVLDADNFNKEVAVDGECWKLVVALLNHAECFGVRKAHNLAVAVLVTSMRAIGELVKSEKMADDFWIDAGEEKKGNVDTVS